MAAPLMSSFTGSKKHLNYVILADIFIATVLFCITFVPFNSHTNVDIVSNPFTTVKILTFATLGLHVVLHVIVNENKREQRFKLNHLIKVSTH